jgi:hypothetical protein
MTKSSLLGSCFLVAAAVTARGSNDRDCIRWAAPVELATGGGERGPWQQNNSRYDFVDDPSVALWRNGDAAIVWVDQARKDVFWQIVAPDGSKRLAAPINVSRTPQEFSWLPRIALSRRDPSRVYVLWQEIVFSGGPHGGEIFFARSLDGGHTFEPPQNLTKSIEGEGKARFDSESWHNGSLDIAVGDDDVIYTVWTDYEGTLTLRRSRDGGKTFEPNVVVARGGSVPARAPSLAIGHGTIYLAWTVGETEHADIHVATSRDGKTFGSPVIAEHTPAYCDAPKLAVDSGGTLHLAYAETKGGPFEAAEIRYSRSRDAHTFEPARVISNPVATGVGASFPSLVVDGERVFVTWEHSAPGDKLPHGISIAYSYDGGASFSQPDLIEGTRDAGPNGGFEGRLTRKLAVSGNTIVVVNSAKRAGESSRVWLVRGTLPAGPRRTPRIDALSVSAATRGMRARGYVADPFTTRRADRRADCNATAGHCDAPARARAGAGTTGAIDSDRPDRRGDTGASADTRTSADHHTPSPIGGQTMVPRVDHGRARQRDGGLRAPRTGSVPGVPS